MKQNVWIQTPSPFINVSPTVTKMSIITGVTLIAYIAMLFSDGDFRSLANCVISVLAGVLTEKLFAQHDKKLDISDGTLIIVSICISLFLPATLHPIIVFFSTMIGIFVARILFGGLGSYWMSPIALAVAIAYISSPQSFPQPLVSADGIRTVGNAFGALKLDHFIPHSSDQLFTSSLNSFLTRFFSIKIPEGYITLFVNSPSVIPAFRYNTITIVASIVLISFRVINWIVPTLFIGTYAICVFLFSLMPFTNLFYSGDILFAVLTSGILFTAFFVISDFSVNPRTNMGKVISGILAGIIAFLLCGPGGSSSGAMFTVIVINILNPLIELFENHIQTGRSFQK